MSMLRCDVGPSSRGEDEEVAGTNPPLDVKEVVPDGDGVPKSACSKDHVGNAGAVLVLLAEGAAEERSEAAC